MPTTYEPIATTTLGSNAASITLSSIPSTFTDLKLIFVGGNNDTPWMYLRFNNSTSDIYSATRIYADGSTISTGRETGSTSMQIGYPFNSTTPSFVELDVFSYTGSTNKTVLSAMSNNLNGSGNVWRSVGLSRNTASVTSITLYAPGASLFYAGATVSLYGIKNA